MRFLLYLSFFFAGLADLQAQCAVSIIEVNDPAGTAFWAVADSNSAQQPLNYTWSNGYTGPSIYPNAPGTYCVVVEFTGGCTATACANYTGSACNGFAGYISPLDSTTLCVDYTGGTPPISYLWSNNVTTFCNTNLTSGHYCVTLTDAVGCTAISCDSVGLNTPCSVWLSANPSGTITADAFGVPPFYYAWSQPGLSGETVPFDTSWTELCVTVTDATGCISTNCIDFDSISCNVYIYPSFDPVTGYTLSAVPSSNAVVFDWSTGETTLSIVTPNPGAYCVTATDAFGCTASNCYTISTTSEIDVFVFSPDSTQNLAGDIWLIHYDTTGGGSLMAIDTVPFTNNYAHISNLPNGSYLVKASIAPGTVGYPDLMPTYSWSELYWSNAVAYVTNPIWYSNIHIYMVEGQNPGGPGFIGGLVSEGANFGGTGDDRNEGDPIEGADIVLTKADSSPVKATKTGANGKYVFDNLAYGTYNIQIDIPGIAPSVKTVTLSAAQPQFENGNFIVDDNSAALSVHFAQNIARVKATPNPVTNWLLVELDADARVTLCNATGAQVYGVQTSERLHKINMAALPSGMYQLAVQYGDRIAIQKIAKP